MFDGPKTAGDPLCLHARHAALRVFTANLSACTPSQHCTGPTHYERALQTNHHWAVSSVLSPPIVKDSLHEQTTNQLQPAFHPHVTKPPSPQLPRHPSTAQSLLRHPAAFSLRASQLGGSDVRRGLQRRRGTRQITPVPVCGPNIDPPAGRSLPSADRQLSVSAATGGARRQTPLFGRATPPRAPLPWPSVCTTREEGGAGQDRVDGRFLISRSSALVVLA